ncbi:MAG: hypothetical protein Q9Q40_15040 [Acidobacteriota bacterium]|nr:hypothetical protein [Acidobacteriota bacterium]MDQ7089014.1 hypothetical protein [Acidobacteriota bacterium]
MKSGGGRRDADLRRVARLLLGRPSQDGVEPQPAACAALGGALLPLVAASGISCARALAAAIGATESAPRIRLIEDHPTTPWHRQVGGAEVDGAILLVSIDPLEGARLRAAALGACGALLWIDDPRRGPEARQALATLGEGLASHPIGVVGAENLGRELAPAAGHAGALLADLPPWSPGQPLSPPLLEFLRNLPAPPVSAGWCAAILETTCPLLPGAES